jgi:hypothetical protein
MKLSVGLTKKIGQPHYGSLAASCHLEVEVESSLLDWDLGAFQEHVRKAFAACRREVEAELENGDRRKSRCFPWAQEMTNREATNSPSTSPAARHSPLGNDAAAKGAAANGEFTSDGDDESQPASASQLSYLRRLASRIGRAAALRIEVLAQRRCGKPLVDLSHLEASSLIATLRAVKAGELDWETVLEEAAA